MRKKYALYDVLCAALIFDGPFVMFRFGCTSVCVARILNAETVCVWHDFFLLNYITSIFDLMYILRDKWKYCFTYGRSVGGWYIWKESSCVMDGWLLFQCLMPEIYYTVLSSLGSFFSNGRIFIYLMLLCARMYHNTKFVCAHNDILMDSLSFEWC